MEEVKKAYGEEIQKLFGKEVIVPKKPFPVIRLEDLYTELEKEFGYTAPEEEHGDLTTEAERLSYEWVQKKYGHEFLFVTDYSADKRAFYHMRDENGVPMGYDLIWRGVEITTGAQREHRYEVLKTQAEEKGLAEDVKCLSGILPVWLSSARRIWPGHRPPDHAASGLDHQGSNVLVPRSQPFESVKTI